MRFEFHPEALQEYADAAAYYAEQQPGLDLRFIEAVEDVIRIVVHNPQRWRKLDDDVRRYLTHVFPYAVLYTIEPEFVLIVAIAHCSREPGYWKHRVAYNLPPNVFQKRDEVG